MTIRKYNYPVPVLALAGAVLGSSAAMAQPFDDSWKFSAGAGVVSHAKYPGSGDTEVSAFPMLSASYGRFIIGGLPGAGIPLGVGAHLLRNEHWHAGIGLGSTLGKAREESDSATLRGLGDIDGTVFVSAFGSYTDKWFAVRGSVVTDAGGKDQGTRLLMDLEGKYSVNERLRLTAGPGFTWADSKYSQTFFGISAAQSASSGRAAYTAASGINSVRFSLGANYLLTPQWGLGARVTAERLRGDAASSPVTERKSQNSVGLFAHYRF